MKRTSLRRFSRAALIVAGLGATLASGAGLVGWLSAEGWWGPAVIAFGFLAALATLWTLHDVLTAHFRELERLRGLVIALRHADGSPSAPFETGDGETAALADEWRETAAARLRERAVPDDRLAAVLAGVHEAVVAVTNQGQVSLLNGAAKTRLGEDRVTVGTSIYAALLREPLATAFSRARGAAAPVAASLITVDGAVIDATVADMGRFRGYVICIPTATAASSRTIDHDLSLHDRPPAVPPPGEETALAELPLTIVDTETTGLDSARDRIVAVAAVRMHGTRLYRAAALDLLVDPGEPIPPAATLVHGITDATVADAPPWPQQAERLAALWRGTVLVGHNIGFDLAMFRAESARSAAVWSDPPSLDTVQLAAALEPDEREFDLERIAARYGADVQGRHTALGDCLIAAAIWQGLVPRLAAQGVTTLGDARRFAARASRVVARQRAAGW